MYVKVAVNSPFNNSILTYRVEEQDKSAVISGALVQVPLGEKRIIDGCILESIDECELDVGPEAIKPIVSFNEEIKLNPHEMELFTWMAKYYHYPLGQLIFDLIPSFKKKKSKKLPKSPFEINIHANLSYELTNLQLVAANKISSGGFSRFQKYLIHGVTGAGKSIVYLEIIKNAIASGHSVLFLVPEINLTPQFLKLFNESITVPIVVYSSALKEIEKRGVWEYIRQDENPKVVVGARSSLFLPIKNLGLIVVDEEHDQSYKQDVYCTYNARDVAIKKAAIHQIPVILGSATPSLESYFNFVRGAHYIPMSERAQNSKLPSIELVDIRNNRSKEYNQEFKEELYPFTVKSIKKIETALKKGEQVLVFINKLGFSLYIQCPQCGHRFQCKNCSVSLKYFKKRKELACQTCDFKSAVPEMCPECMCINLSGRGYGTEKIQENLSALFPNNKVDRFDRDEIKNFEQLEKKLQEFHQGEIDILVGTQMLSKGHNFRRVNLVVILGIDSQLNFPDFRSNEKVYQALTQVSGRAGRFGDESEVLIHTLSPENKIFKYIKEHSFNEFYEEEIKIREFCHLPPKAKLIAIHLSSKLQDVVMKDAVHVSGCLRKIAQKHFKNVMILGPRPSLVEKKVNKFTWSLLLKSDDVNELHNLIRTFEKKPEVHRLTGIKMDIDPQSLDL